MSISKKIMDILYSPDHAGINEEQYQRDKKLYLTLSDKLNSSVRDDPEKMVVLSVISQYLFQKRNAVPINRFLLFDKSSATYCIEQVRSLPLRIVQHA